MQTENVDKTQDDRTGDSQQMKNAEATQTENVAMPRTENNNIDKNISVPQSEKSSDFRKQELIDDAHLEGTIHISEDVIVELVRKTIQGIANIQTAARLASKFGLGRKGGDGIKVSVENGKEPSIFVDVYVLVRYGKRIPDLAWDVQEKVKANLERYTGYTVKAVNINVQGIYIDEPVSLNVESA